MKRFALILPLLLCVAVPAEEPKIPELPHKVHDRKRPLPEIVDPKPLADAPPPANAKVLFDGKNLDQWKDAAWQVKDGILTVTKGDLLTREAFGSCKLHLEYRVAGAPSHGNSGVFMMGLYELQIYDSFNNRMKSYADGKCAAIYGQYPPRVNACRPPGQWQSFDITWIAPTWDAAGTLLRPAQMSLVHNGVVVHDKAILTGPTAYKQRPPYKQHAARLPIRLQEHGDAVQFRNIWLLELDSLRRDLRQRKPCGRARTRAS